MGSSLTKLPQKLLCSYAWRVYYERSMNQTEVNLPVGLRCCSCWKISLQYLCKHFHSYQTLRYILYCERWGQWKPQRIGDKVLTTLCSNKELRKQFVQLYRQDSFCRGKKHGDKTFWSQINILHVTTNGLQP